ILGLYLRSTPKQIREIHDALDRNDPGALRNIAHNLKSSSAMVGAARLAALFRELESLANGPALHEAATTIREIDAEYSRVATELEASAGSGRGGGA
ncbi:MAG: Hpt domain-containing protein, partial [Candidatus Polarisedimenticolia bacterium]